MIDPILSGALITLALFVLLALGIPVGFAMLAVGFVGLWAYSGLAFTLSTIQNLPYATATDFSFLVVPMFILMGALTSVAGITSELYQAAYRWTSGVKGSLYYTTILAAAGFGAINGSTVVGAILFTKIALPEMVRFGYPRGLSAAAICASGTIAALIPPSIAMVLYAVLTGESVGSLLIAGIIPGLVSVAISMAGVAVLLRLRPDLAPKPVDRFTLAEKLQSMKGLWAVLVLVLIVLGGIYAGVLFPSTAGAAGAIGAMLIALGRRKLDLAKLVEACRQSVSVTAVIFLIIIAGVLFSRLLLVSGFVAELNGWVKVLGLTPFSFMVVVILVYLVLGIFVDTISIMVMTIPFLYPMSQEVGVDPIWFGIMVVKLVEISAITPPVGFNIYAVLSSSDRQVSANELFRGLVPFMIFETITVGVLLAFPAITTWLPSRMM